MRADEYRRLDGLVAEGVDLAALRSELEQHPPERRHELCCYAWGLLDRRYGDEDEAALWLYAWALERYEQNLRSG
jgi:hypothetical protein